MTVKSVFKIIAYFVAFLIALVLVAVLVIDANMFKPRIQAAAEQQGIALNMRGDLRWAFWPSIGLAVNEVSVAAMDAPQKIIADVKKASFLVAFMPLLGGDIQVKYVLVDGADINLEVDSQGKGNWEALTKKKLADDNSAKTTEDKNAKELKLSIEKIGVHSSRISYNNLASGQKLTLKNINIDMKGVNLKGKPFNMELALESELTAAEKAKPITLKTQLHNRITLSEDFNSLNVDDGEVQLDFHVEDSASLKINYSIKLDDLKNAMSYSGSLNIPATNLKQLMAAFAIKPVTANPKALSTVSFSGNFNGDKNQVAMNGIKLQLDATQLTGSLALKDFATKALAVDLQGDTIVVDDYLAPVVEESAAPVAAASGDEPLIPVELLRDLSADIKFGFNKLTFSNLVMEKTLLVVTAKNGTLNQQLNANSYSGTIHQKLALDTRNKLPALQFEAVLNGIEVAPLLQAKKLDKSLKLTGAIQANARGQATGISKNQIMESLTANSTFSGVKMQLAPINIEQQFCKFIALVKREEEPAKTWAPHTELRELSGKITIAKQIVNIESLNAGVEKLLLTSTGNINLAKGSYDFTLPLKLLRDAADTATSITTSTQGCIVGSNYWAERSMNLLRCKGKFAEINPVSDCRPDKDMLNALIKDFAAYKLREKYGEKAEAKKTELIKKLDEKLGGEGAAQKAKDTLRNLFKKN